MYKDRFTYNALDIRPITGTRFNPTTDGFHACCMPSFWVPTCSSLPREEKAYDKTVMTLRITLSIKSFDLKLSFNSLFPLFRI